MSETHEPAVAPRIVLTGATGRTGNAVAHALGQRDDLGVTLAACVAPSVATTPSRALPDHVPAFATLEEALDAVGPDVSDVVVVDLTHAEPAIAHAELALDRGVHTVVGATGFATETIDALGARFSDAELGLLVVPNFSVGAVLAMRMAYGTATYFADAEIIETHHDGKRDSPSGTAVHTASLIELARSRSDLEPGPGIASAGSEPARGELVHGVPVHALRLPGASAHQEVVFGSPGELLTIRHDVIDRSAYATGVALAARRVGTMRGLNIGLEHVL